MSCLLQNMTWRLFPLWIACSVIPAAYALNSFAIEKSKNEPCFTSVVYLN